MLQRVTQSGLSFKNMHKMPPKASITHTNTAFILRDATLETNAPQIGSRDRRNCFSATNYGKGDRQRDAHIAPWRKAAALEE
ncbi:hypothetical protein CEXT_405241 [Caerostris extrusa]|uniref:Uncharacterized protein n=1 Tax=Caerostris extrusa TaxID=172846 RepID=A0AAV4N809_CAEEX|nr:hypothetical protein CEXT_405241 [Caerostris extrusa]